MFSVSNQQIFTDTLSKQLNEIIRSTTVEQDVNAQSANFINLRAGNIILDGVTFDQVIKSDVKAASFLQYGANTDLLAQSNTQVKNAVESAAEPTIGLNLSTQDFRSSVTNEIKNTIVDTQRIKQITQSVQNNVLNMDANNNLIINNTKIIQNLYNNVVSTMVNNIVDNIKLQSSSELQNILDAKSTSGSTMFMVLLILAIAVVLYFVLPIIMKVI
jgi:hypothetical protein